MTNRKPFHPLPLLALAAALFLGGCNLLDDGSGKEPEPTPGAELALAYSAAAHYTIGTAILPIVPEVTVDSNIADTVSLHFSVSPALPAGLSLGASGVISGTPTVETDSAVYVIRLVMAGDTARDTVGFAIVSEWYGLPLDSLKGVSSVLLLDGNLLVANRSATKPGVAVVDVTTGKIKTYYRETLPPSSMAVTAEGRVIITETDYVQGAVSVLDPVAKTIQKSVISYASDNGVAAADGKVFLFNKITNAVTGFTGSTPGQGVVLDVQTGAGSNPYGIAISGGKAYIPRYNRNSLLILNDASALGGGTRDSVSLAAWSRDTASGAPRMALIAAHGGYVFVALQRLNHAYTALDTSVVVVINAATKAIEKTIPLTFKNPIAGVVKDGVWYLTGIANYGDQNGGVEKIDLAARLHAGTVITETALAADAFDFVPSGTGTGYVSYSTDFGLTTKVKKVSY